MYHPTLYGRELFILAVTGKVHLGCFDEHVVVFEGLHCFCNFLFVRKTAYGDRFVKYSFVEYKINLEARRGSFVNGYWW